MKLADNGIQLAYRSARHRYETKRVKALKHVQLVLASQTKRVPEEPAHVAEELLRLCLSTAPPEPKNLHEN